MSVNTIFLNPPEGAYDIYGEARAVAAITPGMLIEYDVDGKVQPHSTAGGFAEKMVAIEDSLQGRTIDTPYAIGDVVRFVRCHAGYKLNMLVAAHATAAVRTDFAESAGDGTVRKASSTNQRVGKFTDPIDNSGGAAVARAVVRML